MNERLKILLADDSRFFRAIEQQFLQKTPADVVEAVDSDELLAKAWDEKPDLIYVGFGLRPMDGADCCRSIKDDPELSAVPVVIICDQDEPEQEVKARQSGCDATLVKPLDRHQFLQVGRQFLTGIREHRHTCLFPVNFTYDDDVEETGKCLDISGGGVFLETMTLIPVGTQVMLNFKIPGQLAESEFHCNGVIAWINQRPNPMKPHYPHGLGIKFIDVSDHFVKAVGLMVGRNK